MKLVGDFQFSDVYVKPETGVHYYTWFDPSSGSLIKFTYSKTLNLVTGDAFHAELDIKARSAQGGGQYLEIVEGKVVKDAPASRSQAKS
jgi:hypothetical protein